MKMAIQPMRVIVRLRITTIKHMLGNIARQRLPHPVPVHQALEITTLMDTCSVPTAENAKSKLTWDVNVHLVFST
jgi:hypothetical protein